MLRYSSMIAGAPSAEGDRKYSAINPQNGASLSEEFSFATSSEISRAVAEAVTAHSTLTKLSLEKRAAFLLALANQFATNLSEIVFRCSLETGLPVESRLNGEMARTIGVLRSFADMVLTGEVSDIRIVTPMPDRQPKARPDLRTRRIGLGPVAVIEPANFPLAFGVVGGDTVSAWAAGCPVIAKVHPGHPGTSQMIAECVYRAATETDMPCGIFSLLHGDIKETEMLILHEGVRGVAFTGSRLAGQAIARLVATRQRPLDSLSLEMGSVNPLFVFPGAFGTNSEALAIGLSSAILIGCGQFCTKPGLIFYDDKAGREFEEHLVRLFREQSAQLLLGQRGRDSYLSRVSQIEEAKGVTCLARGKQQADSLAGCYVSASLFKVNIESFLANPNLREEVFGPAALLVACPVDSFTCVARSFEGELTASIHGTNEELCLAGELIDLLELRVGRILFNGYPPGVEVCDAMNHGGPWPAGLSNVTVVGPSSVVRWLRPICYQNAPQAAIKIVLHESMRDNISAKLKRTVDCHLS